MFNAFYDSQISAWWYKYDETWANAQKLRFTIEARADILHKTLKCLEFQQGYISI